VIGFNQIASKLNFIEISQSLNSFLFTLRQTQMSVSYFCTTLGMVSSVDM